MFDRRFAPLTGPSRSLLADFEEDLDEELDPLAEDPIDPVLEALPPERWRELAPAREALRRRHDRPDAPA